MLCEWLTPATCLSVARADINTNFVLSGPEPNDTALCRSPRQHKIDHTYTGVTPNEDAGMGSSYKHLAPTEGSLRWISELKNARLSCT